jgi:hypothetical protein
MQGDNRPPAPTFSTAFHPRLLHCRLRDLYCLCIALGPHPLCPGSAYYTLLLVPMSYWLYPSLVPSDQQSDDTRLSCLGLPLSLPYEVETLAEMDDRLDYIACKLAECVKAREWNLGFRMWDAALGM